MRGRPATLQDSMGDAQGARVVKRYDLHNIFPIPPAKIPSKSKARDVEQHIKTKPLLVDLMKQRVHALGAGEVAGFCPYGYRKLPLQPVLQAM